MADLLYYLKYWRWSRIPFCFRIIGWRTADHIWWTRDAFRKYVFGNRNTGRKASANHVSFGLSYIFEWVQKFSFYFIKKYVNLCQSNHSTLTDFTHLQSGLLSFICITTRSLIQKKALELLYRSGNWLVREIWFCF